LAGSEGGCGSICQILLNRNSITIGIKAFLDFLLPAPGNRILPVRCTEFCFCFAERSLNLSCCLFKRVTFLPAEAPPWGGGNKAAEHQHDNYEYSHDSLQGLGQQHDSFFNLITLIFSQQKTGSATTGCNLGRLVYFTKSASQEHLDRRLK
jgi:hypothetical protein